MSRIKGNYGLSDEGFPESVEASTANALGSEWVGSDAYTTSDGSSLLSSDGLKEYRFPSTKGYSLDQVANFKWRSEPSGSWMSNGPLTVTPDILYG
jgi:filamentous hemagglutinin